MVERMCLWCCVLQYAFVVVVAGLGQCAITPDSNGHVDIPSSWTSIGYQAFSSCTSLTSVTIPDSVTTIGGSAFHNCYHLTSVTIPDSVTSIGRGAFVKCTRLVSVTIPDSITTIGTEVFRDCTRLTSVTIGDSVTTIGQDVFRDCTSLASVTIGNSVKTIGQYAFRDCTSLVSVTIGDNVTIIDRGAFSYCTGLTSVTILSRTQLEIRSNGFYGCSNLQNMTVGTSNNTTFGFRALDSSTKLKSIVFKDTMTSIIGLPLFLGGQYQCKEGQQCGCQNGYGNYLGATMPGYFNCLPCSPGFSSSGTQSACSQCKEGTYADNSAQPLCTPCDAGTNSTVQGATSNTTCTKCARGMYAPAPGSATCIDCPPGSFCNETGLSIYKECTVGRYTDIKSRWNCTACPAGRYQSDGGTAKCTECPMGKFLGGKGANSSSQCLPCSPGSYGDKGGLAECARCPTGQVQPDQGRYSCKECRLEGEIKTNNAAHTVCMDNEALLHSFSIVDIIYSYGTAWVGSMLIASLFVAGAAIVTYYREKDPSRLASFSRLESVYYSFLPGFSFGSWIFLVITVAATDKALAVAMSFSRLLHLIGGIVIVLMLFGDERMGDRFGRISAYMKQVRKQREHMDRVFARDNVYVVEMMSLLSLCDVTMFRFIPWKKSEFYKVSEGFPSMTIMNLCLVIKTVETIISVACDFAFLYLYGDSGRVPSAQQQQTQALFVLNIIFGVGTVVMDLLVLCVRRGVLTELKEETSSTSTGGRRGSEVELGDVYRDNSHGAEMTTLTELENVMHTTNPIHAAALDLVRQHEEKLEVSRATIEAHRNEINELRRRLAQKNKEELGNVHGAGSRYDDIPVARQEL